LRLTRGFAAILLALSPALLISSVSAQQATVSDPGFVVQKYVTGICCSITTIGFVGNNGTDILVLEKASGDVQLIRNGTLQPKPVLHENVDAVGEQGMLSIATKGNKVYLYFTESDNTGKVALGKRVYSYDWDPVAEKLVNRTLIKDLPQTQTYHNGGAMTFDKNGTLYIVVGDAGRYGKLQNHPTGEPDDTSVIMPLVPPGPYYAIGIRNSFGLTVDPVTGSLWDTENGNTCCDEVNIVPPKSNSGWDVIMGPANSTQIASLPQFEDYVYHDPQFTWEQCVAPTGIAFPTGAPFSKYSNSVFVGGFNDGNLYRFELNSNRNGFVLKSPQFQASSPELHKGASNSEIVFGSGFGGITDVKFGPDGFLYIVDLPDGTIYRILPASMVAGSDHVNADPPTNNSYYIMIGAATGGGAVIIFYIVQKKKTRN
jgi:glucose/arabinose dehydrogenase